MRISDWSSDVCSSDLDANAEERPALADHGLLKRVFHARKRAQRRRALAERAHSGKDDAVCGSHLFRCAGGHHIDGARPGGDGKRVGDRAEIASAIIDERDLFSHQSDPPTVPLVAGTLSALRGSISTAVRSPPAAPQAEKARV